MRKKVFVRFRDGKVEMQRFGKWTKMLCPYSVTSCHLSCPQLSVEDFSEDMMHSYQIRVMFCCAPNANVYYEVKK